MDEFDKTNLETNEEKKWFISRIDLHHKIMLDEIKSMNEKYENISTKATTEIKDIRNYGLTGVVIALTVLLGINSSYPIEGWIFYSTLVPILVIGFLVFLIFTAINGLIINIFVDLSNSVSEQHTIFSHSQGYFTSSVIVLSKVKSEYLKNYLVFFMLLTSAMMVTMGKHHRKYAKKYSMFKDVKKSLLDEAKNYEEGLDLIPNYYAKLDRGQPVPQELMPNVDEVLKKYQK